MQKKIVSPTGKLPIRIASKEDVLSTTYLLPSVREIFKSTPGNGQQDGSSSLIHQQSGNLVNEQEHGERSFAQK